ncbi:hypothetical protein F5Y08DRAFT_211383 [Xylaria arbuscula]|nr:hypothetical protein F5Y08DRAFT_211383 [Xylaria arbuscula]
MADIYRLSSMTLIWLGKETRELKKSFSSIQEARSSFPLIHSASIHCHTEIFEKEYNCDISKIKKNFTYQFDWQPVAFMFRLPRFRRKWVIQEVAASKKPILLCGWQSLSWNVLEQLIIYLDFFGAFIVSSTWDPVVSVATVNIHLMAQTRYFKDQPIYVLLRNCGGFDCTNPRDHHSRF